MYRSAVTHSSRVASTDPWIWHLWAPSTVPDSFLSPLLPLLFLPPPSPLVSFPSFSLPPLHLRPSRRSPPSFTSVIITHFTLRSPLDARTCRRSDEERTSLPTRLSIESLISLSPLRASFRLPSLSHHCALRRNSSACDAFLASRILAFLWVAFRVAKIDLFT